MTIRNAIRDYEFALLDKSPHYQRWAKQKLDVFARWLEVNNLALEDLRPTDLRRFHEYLRTLTYRGHPFSSYTLHGYDQVIKGFLHFCAKEDYLTERQYLKIKENVDAPKVDEKVIEIFSPEQIKRLMRACSYEKDPKLIVRDRAILALLLDTGIRASELCGLTLDRTHVTPSDAWVKVIGKGRKEREVGMGTEARTLLHRYISRSRKAPSEEKHVFVSRIGTPLTADALDQMIYRLRDWAGITGVRCSAHTFRHTFAVNYLMAGGDVYMLSRILGHTHVSTTEIYLRAVKSADVRHARFSLMDRIGS